MLYDLNKFYPADGSDEVCEVREKCPEQAFQCSAPDLHSTSTIRPMPSSNITLITDSTVLSSLAAEFEAMRARKMPIRCISRSKLCDGVIDCTTTFWLILLLKKLSKTYSTSQIHFSCENYDLNYQSRQPQFLFS